MKYRRIKGLLAILLVSVLCVGMYANSAKAMTVTGSTSLEEKIIFVNSGQVEEVSRSQNGVMKSMVPVYDENKKHINLSKFVQNVDSITVSGAPEGYPYQYIGRADYSSMYTNVIYVEYDRDDNGRALKDENGNYIVKSLKDAKGRDVTSNGEVTTDLNAYYDSLAVGPYSIIFFLKDGDGNLAAGYCNRMGIDTVQNAWYSVSNLHDGDYYATKDAENHTRAIVLNGYWGTPSTYDETTGTYAFGSLERVKADLKKAMRDGKVETTYDITYKNTDNTITSKEITVTEEMIDELLTEGIALEMTQAAIWSWSNGSQAVQNGKDGYVVADVIHTQKKNPENSAIRKVLYNYLYNLEPQAAKTIVIDEKNFIDDLNLAVSEDENKEDNIYNVDVSFTLDVTPSEGDDLVLEIEYNEEIMAVRLAGQNDETETYPTITAVEGVYTVPGLRLEEGKDFELTMRMTGDQKLARDAYMYVSEGGYAASQPMIGVSEGVHSVDVSTSVDINFHLEDHRVINIHKTSTDKQGSVPLEGIQFDMYYISSLDDFTANYDKYATVEDGKEVVNSSVLKKLKKNDIITTLITDSDGNASYNLTKNDNPDGVYLLVEREHEAIKAPADPFYVAIPLTTEDGVDYKINVNPKNTVLPGPEIYKDVTAIDNDLDSFDVGQEHTWIIRSEIPVDMANGKSYKISDTLDYRLNYEGNLVVKIAAKNDKANAESTAALIIEDPDTEAEEDYTLKVMDSSSSTGEENVDSFVVKLTSTGMQKVADTVADLVEAENETLSSDEEKVSVDDFEIRVYFDASIDTDASVSELIPNQAHLDYTNSVGYEFHEKSDVPKVYTCGINIFKHDARNNMPLANATFKLAKEVSDGEELTLSDETTIYVEYVDFFTTLDLSGNPQTEVVSGVDGIGTLYGLEEGTYYLVETVAPAGFLSLRYPVEVTLNQTSHLQTETEIDEDGNKSIVFVQKKDEEGNLVYDADNNPVYAEGASVMVANYTLDLPDTGGIGTGVFNVYGGVLIALAGVVGVIGRKRNTKES